MGERERFLARLKRTPGGCMEWQGATDGKGYGQVSYRGVTRRAHRIAHIMFRGPIPDGMMVLHRCDNPPCCNPEHLYLGNASDNMLDRFRNPDAKVFKPFGELQPRAKLTNEKVRQIREEFRNGRTRAELSKAYGIHYSHADRIVTRKSWAHLD